MLTRLDKYILKKFLITFVFAMLVMTVLAVAIDVSEKTDDFVKSGLSTEKIITEYYLGFVPWIWGLIYPLFVFIAVIFFTSKMAMQSEVIAIIASGTKYNRWLRPYLIGGLFFALVLWLANRYLIPRANGIRSNFQTTYVDKPVYSTLNTDDFYRRLDSVTYIGIRNYDTSLRAASAFFMEKVKDNKLFYNLRAQRMEWDKTNKNWKLTGVTERLVDSTGERLSTRPDMNIDLKLQPEELRKDEYLKEKLTTPELKAFIKAEEMRASEGLAPLKVEMYRRTATPFTVLLLTMMGAILAGRKTRGGSGLHLAIGVAIASVFILSDRFSTVFSVKGDFHPLIAAWMPNLVFTIVAIFIYLRAPK